MNILELGCGWGSLTLWMADRFPNCQITAVSNSHRQREFIERRSEERHLSNVRVLTVDMREFDTDERFERIVSVEMFEHMRNYTLLFERLARWLSQDGKTFVHIFCHRHTPYLFETQGNDNWMGRHFFTGGMMPSENLFGHFNEHLAIEHQWRVEGWHYWRTCEEWLGNLDRNRTAVLDVFRNDLDDRAARLMIQRWRIFFMACAELFRYRNGNEWFVAQYRFRHTPSRSTIRTRGIGFQPVVC
jgi:cyclopropane-fatty-acyl-phospholipid synthase